MKKKYVLIIMVLFLHNLNAYSKAKDLMNPRVESVTVDESLSRVANIMINNGYDFIPIKLSEAPEGHFIGVVSSTSLVHYISQTSTWPLKSVKESKIIQKGKTIKPEDDVDLENFYETLFVIDVDNTLIGVIAPHDIIIRKLLNSGQKNNLIH